MSALRCEPMAISSPSGVGMGSFDWLKAEEMADFYFPNKTASRLNLLAVSCAGSLR